MEQKGTLEQGDLVELLQDLEAGRKWGLVFIESPDHRTLLSLSEEGIELIADSHSTWDLEELLVQRGFISPSQLEQANAIADNEGKKIKKVLNEQGFAGPDHFEKAVRQQAREMLLDVFLLPEASYEYRESDRKAQVEEKYRPPFKFTFDTEKLIREAHNRITTYNQYTKIISDPDLFFQINEENITPIKDDFEQACRNHLLEGIREVRSIRMVQEELNYARYEMYESLVRLHQEGVIEKHTDETLVQSADALAEGGELDKALRLYKTYLRRDPDDREAAERCAEVLSRTGKTDEASGLYLSLSRDYLEEEENTKAEQLLKEAYENDPGNEEVRELWFDTVLDLDDPERIREAGGSLIHSYIEGGDYGRAGEILDRLLDRFDRSIRLLMVGAELARSRGNHAKMRSYLDRAVDALPEKVPDQSLEAVEYLKKASEKPSLMEDEIREAAGYTSWELPMSGPKLALAGLILTLGIILFVVIRYQVLAGNAFARTTRRAGNARNQGEFRQAIKHYRTFVRTYPYAYQRYYAQNRISRLMKKSGTLANSATRPGSGTTAPAETPSDAISSELTKLREDVLNPSGGVAYSKLKPRIKRFRKEEFHKEERELAKKLLTKIKRREQNARRLLEKARRKTKNGEVAAARKLNDTLRMEHARCSATEKIREPVRFTSVPSGARVFVDGERIGTTPFVTSFPPDHNIQYTAVLDFYERSTGSFTPREKEEVDIFFEKKIQWKLDLTGAVSSRPMLSGRSVLATARSGYVWSGDVDRIERWSTVVSGKPSFQHLVSVGSKRIAGVTAAGAVYVIQPERTESDLVKVVELKGENFLTPVYVPATGRLYVPATPRFVHVVDLEKGRKANTVKLAAPPVSAVHELNGARYVVTRNGNIRTLPDGAAQSGTSISFYSGDARPLQGSVVVDRRLIVPLSDGTLLGIRPAESSVKEFYQTESPIRHGLVSRGKQVAFLTDDGLVQVIEPGDGKIWQRPMASPPAVAPAFDDELLYTADETGVIHAYDRRSGKVFWSTSIPDGVPVHGLFVTPRYILFGTDEGYLYLIRTRE